MLANHPEPSINHGIYQHYKGKFYEVVDVVCHSETRDWYVLYRPMYDTDGPKLWVRPYHMFFEVMSLDGKTIPRFAHVRNSSTETV